MSDDQLYAESDLHLVYLGQDVYGELREKPVLSSKADHISIPDSENITPAMLDTNLMRIPVVDTTAAELAESEKSKHSLLPVNGSTPGENTTVSALIPNTAIPPLLPIVLPLRLLIVDYLKTCTSPLVNPVVGYTVTTANADNKADSLNSIMSTPESSPAA